MQAKSDPRRLLVIGGGISGLSAAWSAWQAVQDSGTRVEVTLLEARGEVGGKARSVARDGYLIETGPTGYLSGDATLEGLVEHAGLECLPANIAAARRFVYRKGRLREIRVHPIGFARSGILSPLGLARLAMEPLIRRRVSPEDESVFAFARRRLGKQAAERLIAPMALGVFAGDARQLSLASSFPRMAELEREYRSLFGAMAALRKKGHSSGGPSGPAGKLTSFAGGLQSLPRALAERAPFVVRRGACVNALEVSGGAWRVQVDGDTGTTPADVVILATEAFAARALLQPHAPQLCTTLREIPSPGVAVVALGYGRAELERAPCGFGGLIPRGAGYRILGVLFDTHLFPGRSPDGHLLLRVMIGGATDTGAGELSSAELREIAETDLARLFGFKSKPLFGDVTRWPAAIPQYTVGHAQRVGRVERELERLNARGPGLFLAGNYLHGIAFGKAALQGRRAGEEAAARLRRER